VALNGLQVVVQARLTATGARSGDGHAVIQAEHVKEWLQRSHIAYDKTGGFYKQLLYKEFYV